MWNDPSGNMETCGDPGMCEGTFDPTTILTDYSDSEQIDAALRNYVRAYPDYNPLLDSKLLNSENFDPQAATFLIGNAQFQVRVMDLAEGKTNWQTTVAYGVGLIFIGATVGGVKTNKAAGDAFRDGVADMFSSNGYWVEKEVGYNTPFGRRVIDIEVRTPDGKILGGIETKWGSSRYTPSQQAKDAWLLQAYNYIVNVVRGGKK